MNPLDRLLNQIATFWGAMNGAQRVALLSVVLITAGAFGLVARFATQTEYGTLYAELDPKDADAITDQLASQGVPYQLTQAGRTVQVPVSRIYDVRLDLATQGLPAAGPVGFEVFDEGGLGMTPFQQRVHFRRALEGELARTIARLRDVDWVRVHISLPDRSVFRRDPKAATAAVVMGLGPGRALSPAEANGISHLVSGAVENLDSSQVTILDERGGILARPGGDDDDALAAEALGIQAGIEKRLAKRAQTLLDAALGAGKSLVTVAATIERRRFEERQERVNPDESAVISEQRSEETRSSPNESFGGVPGTASNLPGGAAPAESAAASSETVTRETLNFDVSRSTTSTQVPLGAIEKLSVAVIVDGTYAEAPAAPAAEGAEEEAPQAAPELVYEPRSDEELEQLREIVMRATGFDAERGDEIVVRNLRFRPELDEFALEPPGLLDRPGIWMLLPGIVKALALVGGLAMLVLFVLRPALRQLAAVPIERPESQETEAAAPGLAAGGAELAIPVSRDQAAQVAEAMRQWLRE